MDVSAAIEKQIDPGSIAFQNVSASLEAMIIVPFRPLTIQIEPGVPPDPPIPLFLHTVTLLI